MMWRRGVKRVRCRKCLKVGTIEFATRPVPGLDAATEHGVVCTACGNWTHSCWMSTALDALLSDAMQAGGRAQAMAQASYTHTHGDGTLACEQGVAQSEIDRVRREAARLSERYNAEFEAFQVLMERRAARLASADVKAPTGPGGGGSGIEQLPDLGPGVSPGGW